MYCTLPVKVKTQRRGLRSPSSTWTGGFFISYDDQIMVMVMIYRCLILFNLDRWVLSSYDDPADQIMVMVVITQKADGGGGSYDETTDDFSFTDNSEVASVSDCVNHPKEQNKLFMLTLTPGW